VTLARMLERADRQDRAKRSLARKLARDLRRVASKYDPMLASEAVPIASRAHVGELTSSCPTTASWSSTPGARNVDGRVYDLRAPTQSYMRERGHLGWAFRGWSEMRTPGAASRVHRDAGSVHIGRSKPRAMEDQFGHRVEHNASGNQSKRGFDRVYGGQQRSRRAELWTTGRSTSRRCRGNRAPGSAWRNRASSRRDQRAL